MLDIAIFYTDIPVYDNDKKRVGAIPRISLGDYTPLTDTEQQTLKSANANLSKESLSLFGTLLHQIGKRFFAAQLLLAYKEATNPRAKREIYDRLLFLYPSTVPSFENIQQEKQQFKSILNRHFTPEQQIQMMIVLKAKHDQIKNARGNASLDDEIFDRGIAECVQALRNIPQNKKSPLVRRLCIRGTHRGQLVNDYSRS